MRIMVAALLLFLTAVSNPRAGAEERPAPGDPSQPERDKQILADLRYIVTAANVTAPSKYNVHDDLDNGRGGNDSGKPTGCYYCNPPLVFRSSYPSEPTDTIIAWTYDLHRFLQQEEGAPSDILSTWHDWNKIPGYKAVRDGFALAWWKSHSAVVIGLPLPSQRGFVYDAIVDGVNIWSRYELLSNISGAGEVMYNEDILWTYRNASAVEILF